MKGRSGPNCCKAWLCQCCSPPEAQPQPVWRQQSCSGFEEHIDPVSIRHHREFALSLLQGAPGCWSPQPALGEAWGRSGSSCRALSISLSISSALSSAEVVSPYRFPAGLQHQEQAAPAPARAGFRKQAEWTRFFIAAVMIIVLLLTWSPL